MTCLNTTRLSARLNVPGSSSGRGTVCYGIRGWGNTYLSLPLSTGKSNRPVTPPESSREKKEFRFRFRSVADKLFVFAGSC